MNPLAQTIDPMLPDCYRDGLFTVQVRDARSVAVFWDLTQTSEPPHSGSRLCVRHTNAAGDTETLILHHRAGHALVPLNGEGRWYRFNLGWLDTESFQSIATVSAELPPVAIRRGYAGASSGLDYRASLFMPLSLPVERRGFSPPPGI
ncbi:MAG: hypothetical protein H7A52_09370 [Akkermansiaceae bacterium]|nr:hypothetical protein [Akkermansiaceae bacterium]